MKCINCGAEIKSEFNICPYCGKSLQMVPDYSIYDEEDINVIIEGAKDIESQNNKVLLKEQKEKKAREEKLALEEAKKRKTKMTILIIVISCILLIVLGVVAKVINDNNKSNSYDYQMKQADSAMFKGDMDSAEKYYLKALDLEPEDTAVRLELADLYIKKGNTEEAITLLEKAIVIDPLCTDAYEMLIDIYEEEDNLNAIIELKENAVKDTKILNLFSDYIVAAPTLSKEGGTYSEKIVLNITSKKGLEIYYTLDGTNPKTNGILYTGKVEISGAGMHTLKVVTQNSLGVYSEVITETYVINYSAPADPVVTPDGGTFEIPTKIYITVPEGCTAYYTWDRSEPNESSSVYVSPITIPEGYNVLSVIIIDNETGLKSSIYRGVFEYIVEE